MPASETYAFQAEINQLLSLIINTFYSNKEIWLRELLSNASDALDKARFLQISSGAARESGPELGIRLSLDSDARTVTLVDTGIGMTKQELVDNLGTIARSGTKGFMEALSAGTDISMIGQFGVGFYSAFLVADRVVVTTKHPDDAAHHTWESQAGGSFTVTREEALADPLERGTRIVLHLKEDQQEYLQQQRIRDLVSKHNAYIAFPIELLTSREVPAEEGGEEERMTVQDWEVLNKQKPVWMRPPEDVRDEEYAAFYKALSGDWEDHLAVKHFAVEGQLEFRSLLFVPRRAPFDLFDSEKKRSNLKLYVRRIFITDTSEELVPEYLNFVRGVVDSEDLPLNISREVLQQNRVITVVRKHVVKKCLEMFAELADTRKEDYAKFYAAFGRNLKLGVHSDAQNRNKLAELLRFHSSKSGGEDAQTSLAEYVARMKEGQQAIYYITGESRRAVEGSPFLERLKAEGLEVLFMVDPIDEYAMQQLRTYDGKRLVSCTTDGLRWGDADPEEEKKARAQKDTDFRPLCSAVKQALGARVESVRLSDRIVKSPCVLVTGEHGWSANMERIMRAQALRDPGMSDYMRSKKTLELNAEHPIVRDMRNRCDATAGGHAAVADIALLLFETALLSSGFSLEDPNAYAGRIHRMIQSGLSLQDEEPAGAPEDSAAPVPAGALEDVD